MSSAAKPEMQEMQVFYIILCFPHFQFQKLVIASFSHILACMHILWNVKFAKKYFLQILSRQIPPTHFAPKIRIIEKEEVEVTVE